MEAGCPNPTTSLEKRHATEQELRRANVQLLPPVFQTTTKYKGLSRIFKYNYADASRLCGDTHMVFHKLGNCSTLRRFVRFQNSSNVRLMILNVSSQCAYIIQ